MQKAAAITGSQFDNIAVMQNMKDLRILVKIDNRCKTNKARGI